jgi:hypothetical protein
MISITKLLEVKYMMCLKVANKPTMEKCGLNLIIWDFENLLFNEPNIKEQGTKQKKSFHVIF